MKKKVVIGCLAAIAVIACAAGFSACKEEGGGHTHIATHHEAIAATCTEDGMPNIGLVRNAVRRFPTRNARKSFPSFRRSLRSATIW